MGGSLIAGHPGGRPCSAELSLSLGTSRQTAPTPAHSDCLRRWVFVPTLQKGTSATKPVSSPQPWTPLLPQDQGQGPWVLRLRDPTSGGAAWHPQPPAAAGHGAPALLLQLHRATELSLGSLPGGVTASSRPVPGQAGSVRLPGNDSEWGGCWGPWSPGLPRGGQGVHAHMCRTLCTCACVCVHVCMRVLTPAPIHTLPWPIGCTLSRLCCQG